MKITILKPAGFNETGGRTNNEDSIYPLPSMATSADTLFLVCDGVGGEHKGEIASALACDSIRGYFSGLSSSDINIENVRNALGVTSQAFKMAEQSNPDTHGMATTMTMLLLTSSGVAVAHLGDSRIYQVRQGKVIFKSKDHKWVNDLVASGVITEEQAREHPKRNVISRAISADRQDEPDFKMISDVMTGDYFFMCTDGVLEQLYDELLEYHLRDNDDNHLTNEQIIEAIKEECEGKTNDNFSAYLIRIDAVNSGAIASVNTASKNQPNLMDNEVFEKSPTPSKGGFYLILILIGLLLFGGMAFYFLQKPKEVVPIENGSSDSVVDYPKEQLIVDEATDSDSSETTK